MAPSNPWHSLPPVAPVALVAPVAPASIRARPTPAARPGQRTPVAVAVLGVVVLLLLLVLLAMRSLGGDTDDIAERAETSEAGEDAGPPGPLVVIDELGPGRPEGELHLIRAGTELDESVPFATDAKRSVAISTFPASTVDSRRDTMNPLGPAELIEVPGGAVVAWLGPDGLEVATAAPGLGLVPGGPHFRGRGGGSIWVNLEQTHILVQEVVAAGVTACHVAPIGESFVEVARSEWCHFSPGGRVVAYDGVEGSDPADERYDVTIFDIDGSVMSALATTGVPHINLSGTRLQATHGDRLETYDARSGELLGSADGPKIRPAGWLATGDLLYTRRTEANTSVFLLGNGPAGVPALNGALASAGSIRVAPFGRRTQALIGARDVAETRLVVVDGAEGFVAEILSAPSLEYRIIDDPMDPDHPYLLAWSLSGDGRVWFGPLSGDPLREVGKLPAASVGPSLTRVVFDPESKTAYASLISDSGSSLVKIDGDVTTLASGRGGYTVLGATDSAVVVEAGTGSMDPMLVSIGPDGEEDLGASGGEVKVTVVGDTITYWRKQYANGVTTAELRRVTLDESSPSTLLYPDVYVDQIGPGSHRLVSIFDGGRGIEWIS